MKRKAEYAVPKRPLSDPAEFRAAEKARRAKKWARKTEKRRAA